jgi:hypothetical protein
MKSLLRPVDVIAEFGLQAFDVEAEHPVHAQLPQLARITGFERVSFFRGEIVSVHHGFEVLKGFLETSFVHLKIEKQTAEMIAAHTRLVKIAN